MKHCINGTEGWQIVPGLEVENCEYIDKPTFGWLNWEALAQTMRLNWLEYARIYAWSPMR